MDEKEQKENKTRIIKIVIYLGIFLVAILIARLSNGISKNKTDKVTESTTNIIEKIKNINDNYYKEKVQIILEDDSETLEFEKISEVEMGTKKYHGQTTEYIKYNDEYYDFEDGNFTKLIDFKAFDYDKTFYDLTNIKKILSLETNYTAFTIDEENVHKSSYDIKDIFKIYNEYNNEHIMKYKDGLVHVEIHYTNDSINYILINATDFFNILNNTELNSVIYYIEISEEKEQDISWILEKLN